jgi:hypothetical protein
LYSEIVPLTVIGKPGPVVETAGGAQSTDPHSGVRRTLASLLEMALGDADAASAAVSSALAAAGRDALPDAPGELVAFVRAHLLTLLSEQIGARLTMAFVDDLLARVEGDSGAPFEEPAPPSSVPRPIARIAPRSSAVVSPSSPSPSSSSSSPSSRRVRRDALGVILVDGDRVGRTSVARALLRAQWNVTVVETEQDLTAAIDSDEPLDAALVDAAHPRAPALFEAIARRRPEAVVVARSSDAIRTRAQLAELGLERFDVRSREAPAEELIDAIKRARET